MPDSSATSDSHTPSLSRLAEIGTEASEARYTHDLAVDLRSGGIETRAHVRMHVQTHHPPLNPVGLDDGRMPIRHEVSFIIPSAWPKSTDVTAVEAEALLDRLGITETAGNRPAVATVYIDEFIGSIHAPTTTWFTALDPLSDDMANLGFWLDSLDERADCMFPEFEQPHRFQGGGSVFYCQELFVHPAAQGQELGLRLLGRALTYLGRSGRDIAVLRPIAIPNRLDPDLDFEAARETFQAKLTPELISYYERAGFEADAEFAEDGGPLWMYRSFNYYESSNRYWSLNGEDI